MIPLSKPRSFPMKSRSFVSMRAVPSGPVERLIALPMQGFCLSLDPLELTFAMRRPPETTMEPTKLSAPPPIAAANTPDGSTVIVPPVILMVPPEPPPEFPIAAAALAISIFPAP